MPRRMPFRSSTRLVEDTDDWYGQRKHGTVDFCGEAVSNFETFSGDNPVRPERVSTDGQWKTGRDGVPTGTYILGTPRVGDVHRSEFAPGVAEDTVRYLSTTYGYGNDPVLDQHVPWSLVELFCRDHDCWVTGENTGLEPGAFTNEYYARGVGFILGVDRETGSPSNWWAATSIRGAPHCRSRNHRPRRLECRPWPVPARRARAGRGLRRSLLQ